LIETLLILIFLGAHGYRRFAHSVRWAAGLNQLPDRHSRCSVISGGQLNRTATMLDPAPTDV
jgi:hypothetical protein